VTTICSSWRIETGAGGLAGDDEDAPVHGGVPDSSGANLDLPRRDTRDSIGSGFVRRPTDVRSGDHDLDIVERTPGRCLGDSTFHDSGQVLRRRSSGRECDERNPG
jgi:hypothetical protein